MANDLFFNLEKLGQETANKYSKKKHFYIIRLTKRNSGNMFKFKLNFRAIISYIKYGFFFVKVYECEEKQKQ